MSDLEQDRASETDPLQMWSGTISLLNSVLVVVTFLPIIFGLFLVTVTAFQSPTLKSLILLWGGIGLLAGLGAGAFFIYYKAQQKWLIFFLSWTFPLAMVVAVMFYFLLGFQDSGFIETIGLTQMQQETVRGVKDWLYTWVRLYNGLMGVSAFLLGALLLAVSGAWLAWGRKNKEVTRLRSK